MLKIASNSLYELVSNKSITAIHQGAWPLLHQKVQEAVPLAGVRMAPSQFECPVPGPRQYDETWKMGRRKRG